ncbi:bi-domain-containing oxidoreductase [Spirosoma sp. BT702]|uniref:Bi-domain-containing oxidoreductase n=1 Tax=Spirosoma profusum TaxID=2771354 RepID=A0A927AUS6_9BACT|nr:bi-domain-containing oxidoreductase [Spirosoma profusum]MBD2704794.1 bi-domain-containing oxidoreductase [Spirosoma profusum]
MKQLIQDLNTGETRLEDVPVPQVSRGQVLIQTHRSLVSLGTERMLVAFGKANLLVKARQQPDRVKQVFEKVRSDGLRPTLEAVFRKLDQPLPLGYCNVGTVMAIGEGVNDLRIGDRVASNGPHAEVVCVPRNLVVPVPDNVPDDEAVFTVIGAIALQSIRLLNPTLGETVVVIGLGLIGLLTADLLRINGCRVIGVDIDTAKCKLAEKRGITAINPTTDVDVVKRIGLLTNGVGSDGVIITASARTDELIAQAAQMSRMQGRIVLVGVVGLNLNRNDFYKKELTFQVSCSYGPGRYDDTYEQQGHDYPLSYVRWTENRNFQTIIQLLANRQLDVKSLITSRVLLAEFGKIYNHLNVSNQIASLLCYPEQPDIKTIIQISNSPHQLGFATVGLIGAGNFTQAILLPALKKTGATLKTIASAKGLNATLLARKYGIYQSTSDYRRIINDPKIDLCIITTRHNSHAQLTIEALRAGKHVFVEKPLAIYEHELPELIQTFQSARNTVLVGFNRRFSPYVQKMKSLLSGHHTVSIPMNVVITVNAGAIPVDNWVHDRAIGGGRILGEACHFVDLITFLTGSRVARVCMNAMGQYPTETTDSASMLLRYENGSTGVVNYFSNGSKAYAKERIEVYSQELTLVLDNFRRLTGYGFRGFSRMSGSQNKGHTELIRQFIRQIQLGEEPLISFADIINTTQTTLAALQSLRENSWVNVATVGLTSPPISTQL